MKLLVRRLLIVVIIIGAVLVIAGVVNILNIPVTMSGGVLAPEEKLIQRTDLGKTAESVEMICNELFPDFTVRTFLQFSGDALGCFPISNLEIETCKSRTLDDGSLVEKCLASGFIQDETGGKGFVPLWCDMGIEWAICLSGNAFPLLSFT